MLSGAIWILQLQYEAIENYGHEKVNCDLITIIPKIIVTLVLFNACVLQAILRNY